MISHRVGSIEKGKDADLVVLDGPWQELASRSIGFMSTGPGL